MPTNTKWYSGKRPIFHIRIIKAIALAGHLSNVKLTKRLEAQHSDVSDAIRLLRQAKLVAFSYAHIRKRRAHENYYALTKRGLEVFISENPTPKEFCRAMLRAFSVSGHPKSNLKPMEPDDFKYFYNLFERNYLRYTPAYGYLIQSPFFNKLYEQWVAEHNPDRFEQSRLRHIIYLIGSPFFEKCYEESLQNTRLNGFTIDQKVLECLAIHRSITEKQIIQYLNIKQEEFSKAFNYPHFIQQRIEYDYAITKENITRVINRYSLSESVIQHELRKSEDIEYRQIMKKYLKFLSHLVVIKMDSVDGSRYELSLLGIVLILAIITHPHQKMFYVNNGLKKNNEDLISFYNTVSQNYADKLPLIFGKWALLTDIWQYAYQSFLPALYQNIEDEFARAVSPGLVSITLGGVKEYQDAMQEIAFHTTAKLFEIYQVFSSAQHDNDQKDDSKIPLVYKNDQKAGLLALVEKQKELSTLLKYADLGNFVSNLEGNKNSKQTNQHSDAIYNSELPIIEKALAGEITFSFYINLARNKFLDYTDEGRYFLGDERDIDYNDTIDSHKRPADFLRMILKSDKELKNMLLSWIADIKDHRERTAEHMKEFEEIIKK